MPARGNALSLTSRRGLRVELARHDPGWAVRAGGWVDAAWERCAEEDLEHTLTLTLGLDPLEARSLARRARELTF
jgi:hypothetical protein